MGLSIDMCAAMKAGELFSTFGTGKGNPMPNSSFAKCAPKTSFAYCWGAQCVADPLNDTTAECSCPMYQSKDAMAVQLLVLPEDACDRIKAQHQNPCKATWNSAT